MEEKFVVDATVRFWIEAKDPNHAEEVFEDFIKIIVMDTRTQQPIGMKYRDTWIEAVD